MSKTNKGDGKVSLSVKYLIIFMAKACCTQGNFMIGNKFPSIFPYKTHNIANVFKQITKSFKPLYKNQSTLICCDFVQGKRRKSKNKGKGENDGEEGIASDNDASDDVRTFIHGFIIF